MRGRNAYGSFFNSGDCAVNPPILGLVWLCGLVREGSGEVLENDVWLMVLGMLLGLLLGPGWFDILFGPWCLGSAPIWGSKANSSFVEHSQGERTAAYLRSPFSKIDQNWRCLRGWCVRTRATYSWPS